MGLIVLKGLIVSSASEVAVNFVVLPYECSTVCAMNARRAHHGCSDLAKNSMELLNVGWLLTYQTRTADHMQKRIESPNGSGLEVPPW